MKFNSPQECMEELRKVGGDAICGVTSKRNVMVEMEGPKVGDCVTGKGGCEVVARAVELFASVMRDAIKHEGVEDAGYLVALATDVVHTKDNIHIISLTALEPERMLDALRRLLKKIEEVEQGGILGLLRGFVRRITKGKEWSEAVKLIDKRHIQISLNNGACTLRCSAKGSRPPPVPLAIIEPSMSRLNRAYQGLRTIIEPLVENVKPKEEGIFDWP